MTVKERIELILQLKGLSKADLARLMQVDPATVHRWFREGFPENKLPRLAVVLRVGLTTLTDADHKHIWGEIADQGQADWCESVELVLRWLMAKHYPKQTLIFSQIEARRLPGVHVGRNVNSDEIAVRTKASCLS